MDRCVEQVQAKGHSKESAIAICYRSVVEGAQLEQALKDFQLDPSLFIIPEEYRKLEMSETKELKDYPWEQCIRENTERYGSEETAKKVCGMIRAKYGHMGEMKFPLEFKLGDVYPEVEKELDIKPKAEMSTGFLYTDLANLIDGRPFDGLTPGVFLDGLGQKVTVEAADLPIIVSNTQLAIEATKTENGEVVGLPIDARNHDKGDAAGWIVGCELEGNVIRLIPRWTEKGIELISKGIQRFFSATLDLTHKVFYGGTLTNWPATRDKRGKILLRPIELSQQLLQMEEVMTEELKEEKVEKPEVHLAELIQGNTALLAEYRTLIEKGVKAELEARLAAEQRTAHIAEFCQKATGGAETASRGLPVSEEELSEFLTGLEDKSREKAEALLTKIQTQGLIDFTEKGHSKMLKGNIELDSPIKELLKTWTTGGGTVAEFFAANADVLGEQAQYNLAEFDEKKEK